MSEPTVILTLREALAFLAAGITELRPKVAAAVTELGFPSIDAATVALTSEARWRRGDSGRWHTVKIVRVEKGGSIGCYDEKKAARSLRANRH